jgi:hypothetical protein
MDLEHVGSVADYVVGFAMIALGLLGVARARKHRLRAEAAAAAATMEGVGLVGGIPRSGMLHVLTCHGSFFA